VALNIKDPDTDRLAREVAGLAGQTITEAVREALIERLDRLQSQARASLHEADMAALIQRGRARQILDTRDEDQILGYNRDGIPG
jgi:antitoxin VapB